jgi:hypothetical protein
MAFDSFVLGRLFKPTPQGMIGLLQPSHGSPDRTACFPAENGNQANYLISANCPSRMTERSKVVLKKNFYLKV